MLSVLFGVIYPCPLLSFTSLWLQHQVELAEDLGLKDNLMEQSMLCMLNIAFVELCCPHRLSEAICNDAELLE